MVPMKRRICFLLPFCHSILALAVKQKSAGGQGIHAVKNAKQRCLSGTGRSDDGDKFALGNGKIYVFQGHGSAGKLLPGIL